MKQLKILNTRESRDIIDKIEAQYGCKMVFNGSLLRDSKDNIYLISREIDKIKFENLRINSMGLYLGEINKFQQFRLSIEGSQIVGVKAKKNVIELTEAQVKQYFHSEEIILTSEQQASVSGEPFLLLKYKNDFFGAAKYKDGKILNYLPKVHRTEELIM